MTNEDASRDQWQLLIQRAIGIPDIAQESAAVAALERELHDVNPLDLMDRPNDPTVESVVVRAVVWAGASGKMDGLLVRSEAGMAEAKDAVHGWVNESTNWSTSGLYAAVDSMTNHLLEKVRSFVEHHPFQDPSGRYFR